MNKKRIVIAGGSGFIGSALAAEWLARGGEVVVLTRSPRRRDDRVIEGEWNGTHLGEWMPFLDGAEAVVNLAGKSVQCRHTSKNVRELTESRVNAVRAIAQAMGHVKIPPRVLAQAGGIGFYGNRGDQVCDENSPNGRDTLADISRQVENAFHAAYVPKTRKVLLRIGVVLGRNGGALPILARMTRWFMGGSAGNGRQFMSWIHIGDLTKIFCDSIARPDWVGTFNAVGPNPVTNEEFMRELRRALHRPWSPPAPAWVVKLGTSLLGIEPSLALEGCRAAPKRFLELGFQYQFPELGPALKDIFGPR